LEDYYSHTSSAISEQLFKNINIFELYIDTLDVNLVKEYRREIMFLDEGKLLNLKYKK